VSAKPASSGFLGLASCLYWAAAVPGNFYSGALAPVDMCAHLFGDLNWVSGGDKACITLCAHTSLVTSIWRVSAH
jgi:hypothetical protein